MFNVNIRVYFSVLNVFIVCIRNTTMFKLIPLMCTHVYSNMFSTVHPPRELKDCPSNMGISMVKWTKKIVQYTQKINLLVKGLKSSKALFNFDFFSWWSLLSYLMLKCRKSSWELQKLSLKVMLKSKCLSLGLDVDFMTLIYFKLEFSFIFVELINLRVSSQNFMKNHQHNAILSYFKQILDNHMFNITYLHTTCTVFYNT